MSNEPISEFWRWFAATHRDLRQAYRDEQYEWLDRQIGPRIKRIEPRLNWELGPYHDPDDTFVLSPTVRQNLEITRAAVAAAPHLAGWHFLSAKPPKQLGSLQVALSDGTINAENWCYELTSYNRGEFVDISIYIPDASRLPAKQVQLCCELVVESLIGEACRLERVGYLLPKFVDEDDLRSQRSSIHYLSEHLRRHLKPPWKTS